MPADLLEVLLTSVRDGYVQVSAFVAVTVLAFSYVQYRTGGALVERLRENERAQPLVGAAMGLTPGCGGAIVMMPLYVRGTVSFGTVVATLVATAGDSAFVILALAPEAGLYAYAIAFITAVVFGYAIDRFGLGIGRVDAAVSRIDGTATDGGAVTAGAVATGPHDYEGDACCETAGPTRESSLLTPISHAAHALWWVAAAAALVLGVLYLLAGAPDVALELGASYAGLFTVVGIAGTTLSFYLYFVGRRYLGDGHVGRARESFADAYDTLVHAAMETSFVTVWVLAAYLLYEYGVLFTGVDIGSVAAAAGLLAPVAGALIGLIPGCGPQIVLAGVYAEGAIPFSALTANAISQDGDALFPLLAVDKTAAVVASIYTTIPALLVGVALHLAFGPMFGFGVLS
ncbi:MULTISPECIES: putative manganese transporter [Halorussus]|uniref:putative manganese transporter n=1 Tax=Halorussus TaxID=1070314 RepID=UPI00209CBE81|nr:putative manganese transporter [Halorussus vallis]USZ76685.1 putative manganese transporter [Halorussus vallis]